MKKNKTILTFVSKGIGPERLFYKGYGSSQPLAGNLTEEDRQKNRRVEFVVVMR